MSLARPTVLSIVRPESTGTGIGGRIGSRMGHPSTSASPIIGRRRSQGRGLKILSRNHPVQSRRMSVAAKISWPLEGGDPDLAPDQKMSQEKTLGAKIDPKAELVHPPEVDRMRRTDGWESVGRLAGAVAHDFNNLLTGVLLYCDLLLALEPREPARKY